MAVCPAVILTGEKLALMPTGRPVTLKSASWVNPLLLFKLTEYEVLVPCCTLADDGPALTEKLDDATTLKLAVETTDWFPTVTVKGPDAAPAGTMKLMLVAVKLTMGTLMLPPPCWLRATWGVFVPLAVKLLPVKVT
jgi:hypothetical protein